MRPKVAVSPPSILIVDDDPGIVAMCAEVFRLEGYHVSTAGDGRRGLELARERRPDVLLMEVYLREIDGLSMLQALRAAGAVPPAVLMTGAADGARLALRSQAAALLAKPFHAEDAVRLVEHVLRRAAWARRLPGISPLFA